MAEQITEITAAELLAAYAAGRRDFHGATLRGADLRGATLSDAYLSGATLRGADLRDATLSGATLSDATLRDATLRDADLSDADLSDATLSGATLTGADLSGATLRDADLSGATLRGADLSDATLSGADLTGADLTGADLSGAYLTGAYLGGADLSGATLRGAKNPPVSSHDFIAAALRQRCDALEDAPENDAAYEQWTVTGLVLISRELCWADFGYMATHRWTAETRRWVVDTLGHWPDYMTMLRRYGFVDDQTAGETNADGQQADAGGTPSPQEAAEAAEWMAPDDQDEQDESDRKRNANAAALADGMAPPYPSEY